MYNVLLKSTEMFLCSQCVRESPSCNSLLVGYEVAEHRIAKLLQCPYLHAKSLRLDQNIVLLLRISWFLTIISAGIYHFYSLAPACTVDPGRNVP